MARPWRIRFPGAKYHVTSRGNGRARIFLCAGDYLRFLDQLSAALDADRVILYAFCLMPNHIHLQVETPFGNLPRFMQRLTTAYGMYFRYKKSRPGHCFQGRYTAKLVEGDDYLLRLTRYIHLNPVRTQVLTDASPEECRAVLENCRWSSYRSYSGLTPPEELIDYRWLKLMGRKTLRGNQRAYRRYIEGLLGKEDDVLLPAMSASRYAIGDDRFRAETEEGLLGVRLHKAEDGDILWPEAATVALGTVVSIVAEQFGVREEDLRFHGRRLGMIKAVAIDLCCRHSGATQREVAKVFGYRDASSVGKRRQALARHLVADPSLMRHVERIEKMLCVSKS